MKNKFISSCMVALSLLAFLPLAKATAQNTHGSQKVATTKKAAATSFLNIPLYFIKNEGQLDKNILYYEKGKEHTTLFSKDGVQIVFQKRDGEKFKTESIKLVPVGARKDVSITAEGKLRTKVNYFLGKDSKNWKSNIPTYKSVLYSEIYKGIDIRFYGNSRQLEYDVIVAPGADTSIVAFSYEGVKGLKLSKKGELGVNSKCCVWNQAAFLFSSTPFTNFTPSITWPSFS